MAHHHRPGRWLRHLHRLAVPGKRIGFRADVGIAIGSGTDVAAETADIVLVDSDPKDIVNLILFGKATYRKMVQNLWWATGYNAVALPLATGFVPGLVINPAFGAALMSISTVICAVNAQLLKGELE